MTGTMTATGIEGQYLLIRRLISRPDQLTLCLCWAPSGQPATMAYFITIAGRRWPVEETFKPRQGRARLGPDPGPDLDRHLPSHCPGRPRPAPGRPHPQRAYRPHPAPDTGHTVGNSDISDADVLIPLGDAPVPVRGGQLRPPGIASIRLPIAETARLAGLARQHAGGLISRVRLAFAPHWSLQRGGTRPSPAGTAAAPGSSP
jgi:hypothetical protein